MLQDAAIDEGFGDIDTRYYWALTPHIYRYNHHNSGNSSSLSNGVHTVNECKLMLWLSGCDKH